MSVSATWLRCGVVAVGLAAVAAGCAPRADVFESIRANRRQAYEAWKRTREGEASKQLLRGPLGTDAAVLIALGNNKRLLSLAEEKENAAGRLTEAYSGAMPTLNLEGRYSRLDRPMVGSATRNNSAVDVVLTQPIFRGGAVVAGIRAAKLFEYFTDEQVAAGIQDVTFTARSQYLNVLLNQELVKVSEGDVKLAEAHLVDVKKKKEAGVVAQYDVLRTDVEVSNVEAQLIQRQNDLHLAVTLLLQTLGVSQESQVELTDKLEYKAVSKDLDDAVKEAFLDRPEILEAELNVRVNRETVKQAWAGFSPRIDASLSQQWSNPDPRNAGLVQWGDAWTAAVTLNWPVFDGLATWGRIQQALSGYRRSVIDLAGAEEQVLLDVKQAYLSMADAEKFVKSQSNNLVLANEALRLARAGYEAGVKTEIEMLDEPRQALSQAQSLYYQAVHRYETAKLAMARATGVLSKGKAGGGKP